MENIRLRVRERVRKYKRRDCCDSENFLERKRERAKKRKLLFKGTKIQLEEKEGVSFCVCESVRVYVKVRKRREKKEGSGIRRSTAYYILGICRLSSIARILVNQKFSYLKLGCFVKVWISAPSPLFVKHLCQLLGSFPYDHLCIHRSIRWYCLDQWGYKC